MRENALRFSLAYSSPVFSKNIINKIGTIGQTNEVRELIYNNILILTEDTALNSFLPLLYQLYPQPVSAYISLDC